MHRGEYAKRHGLLRFELFRKIDKFLNFRNILISSLEGEKKFLSELCELRNFREGYKKNKNKDRGTESAMTDFCENERSCFGRSALLCRQGKNLSPINSIQKNLLQIAQDDEKFEKIEPLSRISNAHYHSQRTAPSPRWGEGIDFVIINNFSETVFSRFTSHFSHKRTAFTLAEVLITLGIIGIVACMTLPVLVSKYREHVTVNRLRQVYSLLKQAESMAVNEYGDINTWDFIDLKTMAGIYPGLNTLVFDKYYKPYLKTAKCNYRATIKAANGTPFITIENYYKYVCLPNGTVIYGNTLAGSGYTGTIVYVDLNGKKSPNVVGRDIFTLLINRPVYKSSDYNTDSYRVVPKCPVGISTCFAGPYQGASGYYWKGDEETLIKYCLGGSDSFYTLAGGGNSCAYMIEQAGWKVPKNYPIKM